MNQYTFIGFVLASGLTLFLCWIAYRFLLESKAMPGTNRKIVLSIYLAMFCVPIMTAFIPTLNVKPAAELIGLPSVILSDEIITVSQAHPESAMFDIVKFITVVYIVGTAVMTLITLINIWRLMLIHRNSVVGEVEGRKVYLHNESDLSCFSWLGRIYLNKEITKLSGAKQHVLLAHESAHVSKIHFMDLIIAQSILIFQWFNPAAWMLKTELQRIHEYEADGEVLKIGIDEREYQNLLIDNISRKAYYSLTDGLNNCSLKKRIIMMKTQKFREGVLIRTITVFSAALIAGALVNGCKRDAVPNNGNYDPTAYNEQSRNVVTRGDSVQANEMKTDTEEVSKISEVLETAEIMPKYGDSSEPMVALMYDLSKSLQYPENAVTNNVEGKVIVRFVVDEEGAIRDIKVLQGVEEDLDRAAIEAVKSLPGKWTPAYSNGKPVSCYFTVPIKFKLQSNTN